MPRIMLKIVEENLNQLLFPHRLEYKTYLIMVNHFFFQIISVIPPY